MKLSNVLCKECFIGYFFGGLKEIIESVQIVGKIFFKDSTMMAHKIL